jgi:hypothetical protein
MSDRDIDLAVLVILVLTILVLNWIERRTR